MFKGFQKPKRLVANTESLTERFGQFSAQPFERDTRNGGQLREVLDASRERILTVEVNVAIGSDHEQSRPPGASGHAFEQLCRGNVRPVHIIKEQDDRSSAR